MWGLECSPEISPDTQLSSSHPLGGAFQRERGAHYVPMVWPMVAMASSLANLPACE